jgi:phosphodiesterase/alkaline phosphatase D-like protein
MNRVLFTVVIAVFGGTLLLANSARAQVDPPAPKAPRVEVRDGPEVELAQDRLTIIRWTANNPGGTPEHYAVIHYGTDPKKLDQTAKSHIRLNPTHSTTVFRVRVDDLAPHTTYYYTVDSMDSHGNSDGTIATVKSFTTP